MYDEQNQPNEQYQSDEQQQQNPDEEYRPPTPWKPPPEGVHWKRLIVCCDGTGQSATGDGGETIPTNVTRFARALETSDYIPADNGGEIEIPQIVLYQTGVGTGGLTGISDGIAGAFGYGLDTHVIEAYTFFSLNYESQDRLFLFGFSRGAFTARAIASLICNVGLLKKGHLQHFPEIYQAYKKRRDEKDKQDELKKELEDMEKKYELEFHDEALIYHLGLWDTVGSLGVPRTWISNTLSKVGLNFHWNDKYKYHDTSFPVPIIQLGTKGWKGYVIKASQALSLDETRISFIPTLLYAPIRQGDQINEEVGFNQVWFPGVHTDVGGGYERAYHDISDITFAWMVDRCSDELKFRENSKLHKEMTKKSVLVSKHNWFKSLFISPPPAPEDKGWARSKQHNEADTWKFKLGGALPRTPGQFFLDKELKPELDTRELIHVSVRMRMKQEPTWRPAALAGFKLQHDETGYYWEKIVDRKTGKKIRLDEWGLNYGAELGDLLRTPNDDALLNGDKDVWLSMETVPEPLTWWEWCFGRTETKKSV